ncbi:MAG: thiamine diphosphokinase [Clostridia bacterium]|nr:thiamine diphosphokinase [Clostridia bacterium]
MRVIIIAGGSFEPCLEILPEDFVICADSGFDSALKYGIHTNLLVGDMDSLKTDAGCMKDKIVFPVRKDYTDSEIAVKHALSMHPDEIILLGAVGTRLDHSVGNIFLLKQIHDAGADGCIADRHNRVYYYKDSFEIRDRCGATVSLIPLSSAIEGITTYGLDYSLSSETLYFGATRGLSNKVTEGIAGYTSKRGEGLLIIASDDEL